jgi:hypothetical protein
LPKKYFIRAKKWEISALCSLYRVVQVTKR